MVVPEGLGGRYELRGLLGRGGMADVREGWDRRLDRPVAIKLLRPELSTQTDIRLRFEAEAKAAATLNHPHVVAVYDSGEDNGVPYIVMERLPGHSMAEDIATGPIPVERAPTPTSPRSTRSSTATTPSSTPTSPTSTAPTSGSKASTSS